MPGLSTVAGNAHVAGGHAPDGAIVGVEDFSRGKARENIHTQCFGLFAQPAGDVAKLDDVVAVILETGGQQPVGRWRSEEHTSELQSLMRISYAVFCLKKKN